MYIFQYFAEKGMVLGPYSCGSGGNIPAYKYDDEDLNV